MRRFCFKQVVTKLLLIAEYSDAPSTDEVTVTSRKTKLKLILNWTVDEVCNWLKETSLPKLENLFKTQEINGEVLLTTPVEEWRELIPVLGDRLIDTAEITHRRRLLNAIEKLREQSI